MPLTNQRSPEQWAALVEEVKQRSAKRRTDKRSKVAKQARKQMEAAKKALKRKGRRELKQKIELVRALAKRFREAAVTEEVERVSNRLISAGLMPKRTVSPTRRKLSERRTAKVR